MSAEFTIDLAGDHVRTRLADGFELTPENVSRHWTALMDFCARHHCWRVLSEATRPRRLLSAIDVYDAGVSIARTGAGLRIACIWEGYTPDDLTAFFQNVTGNRGITVRWFTDRDEALGWLGAGAPPP